jgi:hypothetical protein
VKPKAASQESDLLGGGGQNRCRVSGGPARQFSSHKSVFFYFFVRSFEIHAGDEAIAFATETEELRDQARQHKTRLDWLAGLA